MDTVTIKAFAKVNLSLNIVGATNKLHLLDSVMASVALADTVTVERYSRNEVEFDCDMIENNTAKRALDAFDGKLKHKYRVRVEKRIPMKGGLGGSSADAAAVIKAISLLESPDVDYRGIALSVGSDVPFMTTGGCARVRGSGENMFFFRNRFRPFMVALSPDCGVSTGEAYAEFDRLNKERKKELSDNDKLVELLMDGDSGALAHIDNALEEAALNLAPKIADAQKILFSFNPLCVKLTGSGSYSIAYFSSLDDAAGCFSKLKKDGLQCELFDFI